MSSLEHRLRDANGEELLALLEDHRDELDVSCVRQALRNPFVTSEGIEIVLSRPKLLSIYEVARELTWHPQTPQIHAMRLLPSLFWRDLVRLCANTRVAPRVRRLAENNLLQRLPGLSLGEKVSMARTVSSGVIQELCRDSNPRVLKAALENPRLTETLVAALVTGSSVPPSHLATVANNPRWSTRYSIRSALCRNPRTPPASALSLLDRLKRMDLGVVARDSRLSRVVRNRALHLLGRGSEIPQY